MAEAFEIGDHVTWNSEAGWVSGTITAIHTSDFDYKGHRRRASEGDPQYEIKSDKTDHVAAHKGAALTRLGRAPGLMNLPFHTIGHSTRTLEEFVGLLRVGNVRLVVDIRTVPKSRTNPHYNEDTLPGSLSEFQIGYERIADLGGLRGKARTVPPDTNGFWENQSFHNYADYALSDSFRVGLYRLIALGRARRCAVMCSEAVWWRCHRRIVADHLIARGENVFHLMGRDKIEAVRLTEGARIRPSGVVEYPRPIKPLASPQ